ncbi:putative FYVE finger-containing phosphoinositide kinase, fyv1 [Ixodes scapularis]
MEPVDYRRRAKKLDSPTSLTEFAPLSSDVKSKTSGFSLSRFFKLSRGPREDGASAVAPADTEQGGGCECIPEDDVLMTTGADKPSQLKGEEDLLESPRSNFSAESPVSSLPESHGELDVLYTRSFSGVLGRIAHIMDRGVLAPNAYKDADLKQYWMPDSNCRECYECGDKFTTFRRRHHCRICGQIFCSRCCNREIPGKIIGYRGDLRVCMYCCQVVLSYVKSLDLSADVRGMLADLQNKLGMLRMEEEDPVSPDTGTWGSSSRRKTSVGFREEALVVPKGDSGEYTPSDTTGFQSPSPGRTPVYDKMFIRELWSQIQHPIHGISFQTHRHRLHSYTNCIVGNELLDWLVAQGKVSSRNEAISIGQALIDSSLLEPVVPHDPIFIDGYSLYRPGMGSQTDPGPSQTSSPPDEAVEENQDPLWVSEIQPDGNLTPFVVTDESLEVEKTGQDPMDGLSPFKEKRLSASTSTFFLNLDLKESRVTVSRPRDSLVTSPEEDECEDVKRSRWDSNRSAINTEICNRTINDDCVSGALYASSGMNSGTVQKSLLDESKLKEVKESLGSAYKLLEKDLVNQLLSANGLSLAWADVVLPIVHKVASTVSPNVKHLDDDMDIRQYVHIKKMPGGNRAECTVVSGVVCTKNVVHKKMRQQLTNPRILLVGSSIVYQRVENKLSSLDPILMQEREYLKHVVAKIQVFQPDLLLVEKTVSRLAQEKLLQMDVTLAINVKPSVMERVSRCTQSAIVSSIDAQLRKPNLGSCQNFFVKTYVLPSSRFKTLLFFDGCSSRLGCTILLRGGSAPELKKVKNIIQFMLYVAYNWRLESSFLLDEHAQPPTKLSVDEDDENDFEEPGEVEASKSPVVVQHAEVPKGEEPCPIPEDPVKKVEKSSVKDFSDPLHTLLNSEENGTALEAHSLTLKSQVLPLSNSFKLALESTILCSSPFIRLALPYLKTESGRRCELRKFFSDEIYWSPKTCDVEESRKKIELEETSLSTLNARNVQEKVVVLPYHPFTFQKLTSSVWESVEAEALLADFRARGGRIQNLCPHNFSGREAATGDALPDGIAPPMEQRGWDGRVDALSPYNHQKLAVLFCSYSPTSSNAPYFCVNPWVVNMDFYGRNDIPLGGFLERYCFRSAYTCPNTSCDTPMLEHVRKFAHENGCIQILLHHLDNPLPILQNAILMWSWCRKCRFVTPLTTMSDETWSLSFAKYLELRFHGQAYTCRSSYEQCQHSLHHDHYQYYASQQVVASFKFSPISMREVALPPPVISIVDEIPQVTAVVDEIRDLALKGYLVYNTVVETLCSLRAQLQGTKYEALATDLMEMQQTEKNAFKEKIENIQLQLTSPNLKKCQAQDPSTLDSDVLNKACSLTWKINDSLVLLKHYIADAVTCWNKRLQDFESVRKREEKLTKSGQMKKPASVLGTEVNVGLDENCSPNVPKQELNESIDTTSSLGDSDSAGDADMADILLGGDQHQGDREGLDKEDSPQCIQDGSFTPPILPSSLRVSSSSSSVSSYMYSVSPGIYAGLMGQDPVAQKLDSYAVYHMAQTQGLEDSTDSKKSASSRSHERSRSDGAEWLLETKAKLRTEEELMGGKQEKRGTVKTIISQLLSSSGSNPIQSPFSPSDHFDVSHGSRIPIIVYDQEPSSIIAHALASVDYEQKLLELQTTLTTALSQLKDQPSPSARPENLSMDFNDLALCSSQETDKRASHKNPNMHIETQFSDSTSQFYCRIFFAEQFRKLRCLIFPHGEDRFIHSLSRCVSWSAQGGKSGSSFCKTYDDRFILKQMSRYEVQSFLEFAPLYFQYVSGACTDRQPTVLAKIVGVFRIGYKNSATNAASKLDLLVMENLFYKRNIAQKFDLKGSVRNRLVNTRSQTEGDVVLLDENLLKTTCDSPLYIRPHSKTVLSLAIGNDAKFLSDNSVMDYSLLVGFDNDRRELVVGIIDYIRTFTWDKKLEMVVKSTVTLRGHGKLPTIVWPNLYRVRFCEAMDKYFLCVPDHWSGLGRGMDC